MERFLRTKSAYRMLPPVSQRSGQYHTVDFFIIQLPSRADAFGTGVETCRYLCTPTPASDGRMLFTPRHNAQSPSTSPTVSRLTAFGCIFNLHE